MNRNNVHNIISSGKILKLLIFIVKNIWVTSLNILYFSSFFLFVFLFFIFLKRSLYYSLILLIALIKYFLKKKINMPRGTTQAKAIEHLLILSLMKSGFYLHATPWYADSLTTLNYLFSNLCATSRMPLEMGTLWLFEATSSQVAKETKKHPHCLSLPSQFH